MNFVSTSCSLHLAKMEFLENKHEMQAFLGQAEFKIKSWIIKYGRQESVDLMLRDYAVSSGLVFSLLFLSNTRAKCAKTICVKFSIQNFKTLQHFLTILTSSVKTYHGYILFVVSSSVVCGGATFLWDLRDVLPVPEAVGRGLCQCRQHRFAQSLYSLDKFGWPPFINRKLYIFASSYFLTTRFLTWNNQDITIFSLSNEMHLKKKKPQS